MQSARYMFMLVVLLLGSFIRAEQPRYLDTNLSTATRVEDLMSRMALKEKIGQMNQYLGLAFLEREEPENALKMLEELRGGRVGSFLMVADVQEGNKLQKIAEESRLRIPVLNAIDAIHGHCLYNGATVYPTCIGMASSFNTDLVERIHVATAKEMRATGYHWAFFPYLSVSRDPRWGRVGENFGEDPLLVSEMAAACVRGFQGDDYGAPDRVLACAKVLLGDGQPINGLNFAPMDVSERTLYEIFLPPAKACVDAGARTFMAAHNEINGVPCHSNHWLLTEVLREAWGFRGYTISDWKDIERLADGHKVASNGKEAVRMAVAAGVDVHMHGSDFVEPLEELVVEGAIPEARIDRAVRAILTDKFRLGLFEDRFVDEETVEKVLGSEEHVGMALEMARQSIVLLKNEGEVLPLSKSMGSLLITGPLAESNALVGDWVHTQPDENIVTIVEGIEELVSSEVGVEHYDCGDLFDITEESIKTATEKAKLADAVVVVVGGNDSRSDPNWDLKFDRLNRSGGENIARSNIDMVGKQLELVQALCATGKPLVVVLINGRPLAIEWIAENVSAVVEAWQPGMQGGKAVAEVLFGDCNPSGRLPITIPRSVGHLLSFYNHRPIAYLRNYKYGKTGPLFEFGHGLSYTTFDYGELQVPQRVLPGSEVKIGVEVTNTGARAGDEVVLVFVNDVVSSVTTPIKELKAFKRIHLEVGETKRVEFSLNIDDLALYDVNMSRVVEPGTFEVMIGDLKGKFEVVDRLSSIVPRSRIP